MRDDDQKTPQSTARIAGHPIHPMLVPFPIACFAGTLLCDIAYAATAQMQWSNMAAWLLAVGLVISIFVVVAGAIDFLGDRRIRNLQAAWIHSVGNGVALCLAILDLLVHSRDAYTSVMPEGLGLSVLVVLILFVTGWNGWTMVYRHGVGVRPENR
ncbi:MAG TPA: DUF2231 domain-containing protein [Caulobacteraceae bacterium]|jgi:uncharacterized membrane protein|nr:DUF2231 domain-containing protein [Caulobacteraceae bacterium]